MSLPPNAPPANHLVFDWILLYQWPSHNSLPGDDPPTIPNDVSPAPSIGSTNDVVVEPILEEIGSDVEVMPAKVINADEWNAHNKNNKNNNNNDDHDDDDNSNYGKKMPAKENNNNNNSRDDDNDNGNAYYDANEFWRSI